MKWFSKLQKETKTVLIIVSIVILVSGLMTIYANVNAEKRLEESRKESRLQFVSLDEFRTYVNEKELSILEYDVQKDIFVGILKEEAKIKYGITGSGRVALANISKLVEENQITNEVILESIKDAERLYYEKPTNIFITITVTVIIMSVLYLRLIRPIRNNTMTDPPASKKSNKSQNKNEELKEKVELVKLSDVKGHDEIKDDLEFLIKF